MRFVFLVAALLSAPTLAVAADDSAALVAKVVAAYGGRSSLERARGVRQEGTVTSVMHEGPGHLARVFQQPGNLRVDITYPGEPTEVRVVHGERGERNGVEVTGTPMHDAMVLQAARLALPLSLVAKGARVSDRGTVERGPKRFRVLALTLPGDMELVVEVDPATGRILRSSGSMPGPGQRIEFATEYSDFRKVAGLLFAFREENWARGQHTGATTLSKVEVLPSVPSGTFSESL
jgi:hypothetical protein